MNTELTGSSITYDALIQKAIELEADDIINVRIDKSCISNKSWMSIIFGNYIETITYKAHALAVQYTDAIPPSKYSRFTEPYKSGMAGS